MNPLEAQKSAEFAWDSHARHHGWTAVIYGWSLHIADDGAPLLVGRVTGPAAEKVLASFAGDSLLILGEQGDQRPTFDYSEPGRVACLWRTGGMWVRLWTPDASAARQKPLQRPALGGIRAASRYALAFLRRTRPVTEKESATA